MNWKEYLVKVRDRIHSALIGHANMELDKSLRRESKERLKRIDEKLKRAEETCEIEIPRGSHEPVRNGTH